MLDEFGLGNRNVEGLLQRILGRSIQLVLLQHAPNLVQGEQLMLDALAVH